MTGVPPLTGQDRDFLRLALVAAGRGALDAVRHYADAEPSFVTRVGPHGRTMLWEAARGGHAAVVDELADRGAAVDAIGCYYRETRVELSPWCIATIRRRDDARAALERRGAGVDFAAACFLGDARRVDAMLASDPAAATRAIEREHRYYPYRASPLHYSVAAGRRSIAARLIDAGAHVPPDDALLFRWAREEGDPELVALLIDHGLDPARIDEIDWAAEPKWRDLAARFGIAATIDTPCRHGFPPIVEAARGNHNAPDDPARIDAVLARGANVDARDYKGKAALHRAAQAGFEQITARLIAAGADVAAEDHDAETPLFDAIRAGRSGVVAILLEHGANPEHRNAKGQAARDVARRVKKRDADGVRRLLA